ncbi:MAG TPA: MFS transporter [Acidobacteriota bacterium]|nr:MFS transporter [Acidobacteriota bacterium]
MKAWDDLKAIPRPVWNLSFATFVNRVGTMVLPFLVIYLTRHLGFTLAHAGLVVSLYGAGALIAAPSAGFLCDKFGPIKILKYSLLGAGILLLIMPSIQSHVWITVAVVALALVTEMFRPASMAAVTQFVTPEQRKPAYALSRLAINLGMSVGPAVGGFLAAVSYKFLFWIDGATSLLAFLLLTLFALPNRKIEHIPDPNQKPQTSSILSDSNYLVFLIAVIPIAFVFFQHISGLPLYMVRDLKLSEKVYGLMFTLNTLLIVALELPINLSTTHWSHRKGMVLGTLLMAVGFGALALAQNVLGVMVTVVIWTFGEMILFPAMSAYVAHIAPPHRQGQYMGFYVMTFGIGFTLAPWGGTQLLDKFGGMFFWMIMFGIGLISVVLMAIFTDA